MLMVTCAKTALATVFEVSYESATQLSPDDSVGAIELAPAGDAGRILNSAFCTVGGPSYHFQRYRIAEIS